MLIIGNFIKLRKKESISREHLAVRMNLSSSAIQNVETDKDHNPSNRVIAKYIKYFGVDYKKLVDLTDVMLGDAY